MNKNILAALVVFFMLFVFKTSYSQGCSDAGLCAIDGGHSAMDSTIESSGMSVSLSNSIGIGDNSVLINSTGVSFSYSSDDFSISAGVPFVITSGDLGSTSGLGDVLITLGTHLYSDDDLSWNATFGGKIATNNADLKNENELPMPMVNQTSMGTNDLIFLTSLKTGEWQFTTGLQTPLNRNENSFTNDIVFEEFSPEKEDYFENRGVYEPSRKFKRGSDVMLKIEKFFDLNDDLKVMGGILPVYRLENSVYESELTGEDVEIIDSDGLTLNIIGSMNYKVSDISSFKLNLGFPVITRTVRADGLTRAIVATISYSVAI